MISLQVDGATAVATMSRPPVNAMNDEWVDRFIAILDQLERDTRIAVLRIRSSERVFCAGADLEQMRSRFASEDGRAQMIEFTRRLQGLGARLETAGWVSIAQIGGAAMGGGMELALGCDLRIVADDARIGLPEARLGLLPAGGGTQRMTRLCGDAVARRLILGAEVLDGPEAVRLGLAHWSVPAAELESAAAAVAGRIAELPRDALAECKRCIAAALDPAQNGYDVELAGSARLLASAGTQQRVRQFLERRK